MQDRRQNPRYPYRSRIAVVYPDGRAELVRASDISIAGVSIHVEVPVAMGTPLRITIFAYDWRARKQLQIEALTRACHCVFDTSKLAFRVGLTIETFVGDGQTLFDAEIEAVVIPSGTLPRGTGPRSGTRPNTYPLRRRFKLVLDTGQALPGWTEEVTPNGIRACLDENLPNQSVYLIQVPVLLQDDAKVYSVRAKARVEGIVFQSMGTFQTTLHVFDYEDDGQALLTTELRQRFPAAWAAANAATHQDTPEQMAEDIDAEALQPLVAGRDSRD